MAFKMKGGKDPMKKNFGSAMKKPLVGNQKNLPPHLKKKILDAPTKAMKNDAPMMRMDPSAMKAMGKPAPVKAMDKSPMKDGGLGQGIRDYFADLTGRKTSKERAKHSERENELRNMRDNNPKQFAESSKNFPDLVYDPDKKK